MLSISIVTYHVDVVLFREVLQHLVKAVTKLSEISDKRTRIRVIDNGNQKASLAELCVKFDSPAVRIEVSGNGENTGYGRAHNLAILNSSQPFHLILNPDVLLDENCLVEGLRYIQDNPSIAALAPSASDGNGEILYLSKRYPSAFDLILRGFAPEFIKKRFGPRLADYELREIIERQEPAEVPLISGCFMLCDTRKLKQVGGFDERFFLYFEDYALSKELAKLGKLIYLPKMKIVHYGGNSAGKGIRHIVRFIRSGIKFFNIYGWKVL